MILFNSLAADAVALLHVTFFCSWGWRTAGLALPRLACFICRRWAGGLDRVAAGFVAHAVGESPAPGCRPIGYAGGFIDHYLWPLLSTPAGLTRECNGCWGRRPRAQRRDLRCS